MFVRHENFHTFTRFYPIVTTIVIINFLVWIITSLPFGQQFFLLGVGSNYDVYKGEYWRLLTPIFLHSDFGHVLFNSFSLILFGPALEKMIGKPKFLLTYIIGGILTNICTYLVGPLNYFHLGSSSAIFGLFGIYLFMVIYRKDLIDRMNSQVIISILIIGLAMTFFKPNVNIYAHIFGLIIGVALAPIVLRKATHY